MIPSPDERMSALEERIRAIESRNGRVEAEKRWEVSGTRRAAITVATYFIMVLAFSALGAESPLANATIPTLGFVLSNLSLPLVKRRWIERSMDSAAQPPAPE